MIARLLGLALALTVARGVSAQAPIRAGYATAPDVAMRIWVPAGLVRIVAWDRDSVDVSGTNGKRGRFFGGGNRTQLKFGIDPLDSTNTTLPGADITVRVPRRARVWVKMTAGHVDAEGTAGELEVSVVGGSVAVRNAQGVIAVESIDAPVTIDRSEAALRIRGGKGIVTLRDVAGTASIATVSGNVVISGARAPDATVETIGGAVDAELRGAKSALDVQTHSGAITLRVDPARLPAFALSARSGSVRNPFPAAKGAATVVARSFKGDINVVLLADIKGR